MTVALGRYTKRKKRKNGGVGGGQRDGEGGRGAQREGAHGVEREKAHGVT